MLSLDGSDLGHSREDVSAVGCRSLHAVAMIDLSLTRFLVHVELGGKREQSGQENWVEAWRCRLLAEVGAGTWTLGSEGGGC